MSQSIIAKIANESLKKETPQEVTSLDKILESEKKGAADSEVPLEQDDDPSQNTVSEPVNNDTSNEGDDGPPANADAPSGDSDGERMSLPKIDHEKMTDGKRKDGNNEYGDSYTKPLKTVQIGRPHSRGLQGQERLSIRLYPQVKAALDAQSKADKRSSNYIIEDILIKHFGLEIPSESKDVISDIQ